MLGRWPNGRHFAGVVWQLPFAVKNLPINDVILQYRPLSASGLLSIVSNYGKKKPRSDGSEDASASRGVLGKIGKQRQNQDPAPTVPVTNEMTHFARPQNGVQMETEKQSSISPSNVIYDDRWAKLINPGVKNGTKARRNLPKTKPKMQTPQQRPKTEPALKMVTISEDITLKILAHKIGKSRILSIE